MAAYAIKAADKKVWIIDSGACQHLCSSKEMLVEGTYQPIAHRGIVIAEGSLIEAIERGDIQPGSLRLMDRLHVPQMGG